MKWKKAKKIKEHCVKKTGDNGIVYGSCPVCKYGKIIDGLCNLRNKHKDGEAPFNWEKSDFEKEKIVEIMVEEKTIPKFKCKKHGEINGSLTLFPDVDDKDGESYCMWCYVENVIRPNCEKAEKIKDNKKNG